MTNVTVRSKLARWLLLAAGWAFMVLGFLGLFLPVLQGVLFLLIGLVILSSEYVWAHNVLHWLKTRFPSIFQRGHEAARKVTARFHRLGKKLAVARTAEPPTGSDGYIETDSTD